MKIIEIKMIPIEKLVPHPVIERRDRIEDGNSLKQNIEENGMNNPPKVMRRGNKYEIIDGHRRIECAKALGWTEVKCEIVECSDYEALSLSVQENEQRESCSPQDMGRIYDAMEKEYLKSHPKAGRHGGNKKEQTEPSFVEFFSKNNGIPAWKIYQCLRIFRNLDEELKKKIVKRANLENQKLGGIITEEVAGQLSSVPKDVQRKIYKLIKNRKLTTEQVAQLVEKYKDGEDIDEIGNIDEWYPDFRRGISCFRESRKILGKQTIFKFSKKESKEFYSELAELKRNVDKILHCLKKTK